MNAERLLAHYERIADAPDAIARLRRFILDLAVRGKLVPQDPKDEPASDLLKRIAKEKARLVKAGEFREPSNFVRISREALPFQPAPHWGWARLIDIARPSYGFAFASSKFNSAKRGMPLIRIRDISGTDAEAYFDGDYDPTYLVNAGDYLVGMDGDFNLRRWRGVDGLLNQRVMRINGWRCGIDPEFVKLPLQFVLDHLHGQTSLTTVKHLSAKQVNGIEIPLPPLAEQHRIVAKVDELMALCDQLEKSRTAREETRDRLTAASLARLNDPSPETFQTDARFALDALPSMTARPDQIKQLRQMILNLAVRGRLVPQDLNDEPAAEALRRIAVELAHSGKHDEVHEPFPFIVSKGWQWTRLGSVVVGSDAGWSPKTENHPRVGNNWGVLKVSAVSWGEFRDWENKEVLAGTTPRLQAKVNKGDFLISRANTAELVARAVIVEKEPVNLMMSDKIVRLKLSANIDHRYILIVNNDADFARRYYAEQASGVSPSMKNVSRDVILNLPFPLPPLPEQERIVAKVDELMALCDQLEASLVAGETVRGRLLDALLHEALEPSVDRLEAAA